MKNVMILCSMAKKRKDKKIFTEFQKDEFDNIIITVKDKLSIYEKHTITHTHTNFSMSRKNNRQDKGKGIFISNLIKGTKRDKKKKKDEPVFS